MKRYGVGLIGAGWVGEEYVRACRNHPALDLVGIYTRTPAKGTAILDKYGMESRVYQSLDELFEDERVGIVISATTPDVRAEHVIRSAESGRHVVAEKPLTVDPAELSAMCEAVRSAGVKSITSFVLRFNPQIVTARHLISEGALGDIVYAEADYWNPSDPAWPCYDWLRTRALGGSAFVTGGCHAVDVMRYLAGEIVEVSALSAPGRRNLTYEYDPIVVASVRFEHGGVGKVSAVLDGSVPYHLNTRLIGTEGSLDGAEVWAPKLFPGATGPSKIPTVAPDSADVGHHPFYDELDYFVSCIENDIEPHSSILDAAWSMAVTFAIDASSTANGEVVKVSEMIPDLVRAR